VKSVSTLSLSTNVSVAILTLISVIVSMSGIYTLHPSLSVQAALSIPTENLNLNFNKVSVFISLAILGILLATTSFLAGWRQYYLKLLPRDVDTLGSVLGFVYASERLLNRAAESNNIFSEKGEDGEMTKMGWFNAGGRRRWGIEIVDHRDGSPMLMDEIENDSLDHEVRAASFDTYEAIAEVALRTPPRPNSRFY